MTNLEKTVAYIFVVEAAEGIGMDNAVAVTLESSAHRTLVFRYQPAPGQSALHPRQRELHRIPLL
jgi:hypothetical protein